MSKAGVPGFTEPKVMNMAGKATRLLGRPIGDTGFRTGMWVVARIPSEDEKSGYREVVGIAQAANINGELSLDLVNPDGTTLLAGVKVPFTHVRQCLHEEIPAKRRPNNNVARAKGYM